jgi:hypothetical protein
MPRNNRNWTAEEENRLLDLIASGAPRAVIAKTLQRTEAAIEGPNPLPARYLVRLATRGWMVWDRRNKGPAIFVGSLAAGLSKERAEAIKVELMRQSSAKSEKS